MLTPQQGQALINLARVRQILTADPRLVAVMQRFDGAFRRRCEMRHRDSPVRGCPGCESIAAAKFDWYENAHRDLEQILEVVGDLKREAGGYSSPATSIAL